MGGLLRFGHCLDKHADRKAKTGLINQLDSSVQKYYNFQYSSLNSTVSFYNPTKRRPAMQQIEQNKATYRRFYEEFLSKGNLEVVDQVVDKNVISHSALPGQKPGAEGLKEAITMFRRAFPDLTLTAEDIIAEGDKVVGRFTV